MKHLASQLFELQILVLHTFELLYRLIWLKVACGTVPLLDFFPLTTARPFVEIVVPPGYDANYFQNYFVNNPNQTPDGPDADDD